MAERYGLNVSDAIPMDPRLADKLADEQLRRRNDPPHTYDSLNYSTRPMADVVTPGEWMPYSAETAKTKGWPVGGRVRFVPSRWEVQTCFEAQRHGEETV